MEKVKIRKEILAKLRAQSACDRQRKSAQIKDKLFADNVFKSCACVMFYVAKNYEVDTQGMIKEALKLGKRVVVPVTSVGEKRIIPSEIKDPETELEIGPFGIKQPKSKYMRPVPVEDINMVITPAVVFDDLGNRIGHGAGYYDSFLKTLPPPTLSVGLAFDFQILKKVPSTPSDVPVKKIIFA
ncbi:MAG: 5-formyltetrahydrofolate cyclo-ligase [Candidatus Omnitrophota bacterium]